MTTRPEEKTAEETTTGVGCEEDVWTGTQPRIIIETEDNAANLFVHTFVSTLHKWIVGGIVLLMVGAFLALMGVV
tara:strand:- start:1121 stop:1345 length:225 start_codon:yes stop_codon:yes gene_type:complete